MTNKKNKKKITGSIDSIESHPIQRAEPEDIEIILDEFYKRSKIQVDLSRDELKRMIVKVGDYSYTLEVPVNKILNKTLPLTIEVNAALFDPSVPKIEPASTGTYSHSLLPSSPISEKLRDTEQDSNNKGGNE